MDGWLSQPPGESQRADLLVGAEGLFDALPVSHGLLAFFRLAPEGGIGNLLL